MASQTLQYIKLDYQSQKDALLQRIRNRWPSRWNDFLANSIGIVLVDIVAWALATLAFLVNRVAGENYIPTMTLRESAIRIGGLTGYQLRGPVPATVLVEATLTTPQSADTLIAQGTLVRTSDSSAIAFQVSENYTIAAGNLTPQQLVATFSPIISGTNVINTFLQVTNGSSLVTAVNTTIDLSQFVQAGQTFIAIGDDVSYTITGLSTSPGSSSSNDQLVLDSPWSESTGTVQAQVFEQRIALIQGQSVTDSFIAPDATAGYTASLSQTPVIQGSVTVMVNGVPWTQTSTVGIQSQFATVFQVTTYVSGVTAVVFGDGVFGALLPSDAAISVSYMVGGGSAGNIALNTINTSITGLVSTLSNPVSITITNQTATGSGGQDAETLDQARVNIPYYTRTNGRAVTLSDYSTMAAQFTSPQYGSVAYANAVVRTENSLLEGNVVSIYAWTTGPGGGLVPLPSTLSSALADYLQTVAIGTDFVQILNGTSTPVPISLLFSVLSGFSIVETESLVLAEISSIITPLLPGQPVIFSDLVVALAAVTGVDNLVLATPTTDLYTSNNEQLFTVPNDSFVYTLTTISVGQPFVDVNGSTVDTYTVQLPVFPLQAWSFTMTLGVNNLSVVPYLSQQASGLVQVQQCLLLGPNLSLDPAFPSTFNLLTGQGTIYVIGAPGNLNFQLITAIGYSSIRTVDLYIGYQGNVSQNTRQQIRSALQAWGQGFGVGSTIYANAINGVSASVASVTAMLLSLPGVTSVNRVALDTPANTQQSVTAADYELLQVGDIILNNQID
jgi:hypothetical protein